MRVLVTGGAGFIGSHLTERLLARGDDVLVIDNYATGRRDTLQPHPRLHVIEGSVADSKLVGDAFARIEPQAVVHAAASYKDPDGWEEDTRTNVTGTAIVAKAARDAKVSRLIYLQTALCYGLQPLEQPITLNHPLRPEGSSYSVSKTAGEHYIRMSGVDWISFRLANAYGPRNLSGPLPTFYQRLAAGKPCFVMDTRRDFMFIEDLLNAIVPAVDGRGRSGPYHVSSGADFAIKELFDAVVNAMGITLPAPVDVRPRQPGDAFTILLDPSETERDLNWRASTPLASGVAAAIDWYRGHGVQETFTHLDLAREK